MNIVNLTPHEINIYNQDKELVLALPSSGEARCQVERVLVDFIGDVPVFESRVAGEPTGLPDYDPETICIVSGIFRASFDRDDLYQPGELLRNEQGQPIGCIGLSR